MNNLISKEIIEATARAAYAAKMKHAGYLGDFDRESEACQNKYIRQADRNITAYLNVNGEKK